MKTLNIVSKKNFIVNTFTMKHLYSEYFCNEKYLQKAKINLIIQKSTQISTVIKYQEKVLDLFAYQ